ncbi:outer membrane protein assembly factor BamA [Croceicoccus sp. F390]|uniref:Outer membrane protein assembly factor BamA n=1 Tax=Croceicoccus esteveae TaxID=3075597 RepID=A0ABU2ZKJ8_9SPHN|nr:outer membrane protein assembly factor BamA [Croceicoccus sp. F390]MDT0576573.1 outer membrane protein assembly factor BamA [Croceicoccus sp. F390]
MTAAAGPRNRLALALLAGTALSVPVWAAPADAQETAPLQSPATQDPAVAQAADLPQTAPVPASATMAEQGPTIRSVSVAGAQRLEAQTILSYIKLAPGDTYTQAKADAALKDLYATELFADVRIGQDDGRVVIQVQENPVINRIVLEGNKRLKDDKILPEIRLAPRQIYTRSKVRADVARIIELYKRQGRFAATVEPQSVQLDQNRVDIVFEIKEGPKSKVRQINVIGNEKFSDGTLRGEMLTKQTSTFSFISGNTSYDPDKLAFDQQKLRQFYLTQGYADFRVISAVAELTPDKRDFIITYVVEEGERYKFGDVKVDSQIRDFDDTALTATLPMDEGDWYDAKLVEDTIERLAETIGAFGYAFGDVQPQYTRNKDDLTMGVTFQIAEAPRVYVERIDINGNTLTQDKVIRREFRLAEGDAFNSLQVRRSTARINSLGYFQENFEIQQSPGSTPDRIVLAANVEEKPTGELQLSAGFSSLESFILQGSIQQRNFRGRGQTVGLSLNYSRYTKSAQISFTEPYVFDSNVSFGADIYRRDYNSFNYFNNDRNTTYENTTTGFSLRAGTPLSEYMTIIGRYTLQVEDVTLGDQYFADFDNDGIRTCEPLLAGRYLCDALGNRTSSLVGASLVYDTLNNRLRPSKGERVTVSGDFAGLGGSVKYLRGRLNGAKYWGMGSGFVFSVQGEGGYIHALESRGGAFVDDIRLTDRFFLGNPQMRGFDIRGVGPRVIRKPLLDTDDDGIFETVSDDRDRWTDDALGGKAYYLTRAELEIPLGSGARELGLRPSLFVDAGAVFALTDPLTQSITTPLYAQRVDAEGKPLPSIIYTDQATAPDGKTPNALVVGPFVEQYLGDTPKPRVAVGIGVNWNSPFGPLRIDISKALLKEDGDDPKAFSFNVGTQF